MHDHGVTYKYKHFFKQNCIKIHNDFYIDIHKQEKIEILNWIFIKKLNGDEALSVEAYGFGNSTTGWYKTHDLCVTSYSYTRNSSSTIIMISSEEK